MSRARDLCFVIAALLTAPPGSVVQAEEPPRSALEGVPGLEKRITYTETKIPLGELVAKVAADTGVPLRAAPDVADEPVAVAVTALPARELLEQIADLLDYQWRVQAFRRSGAQAFRSGKGGLAFDLAGPERLNARTPERPAPVYEIWQDLASKQREEALRRSFYAAVEQRFQEDLERYRAAAKLSPAEIRRQWDDWLARGHELGKLSPDERQAWLNSPEAKDWDRRLDLLQNLTQPIQRSLAGLLTGLSPEQWAALRAGQQLVFSSAPHTGELPLTHSAACKTSCPIWRSPMAPTLSRTLTGPHRASTTSS